jgi:hypothetical protein
MSCGGVTGVFLETGLMELGLTMAFLRSGPKKIEYRYTSRRVTELKIVTMRMTKATGERRIEFMSIFIMSGSVIIISVVIVVIVAFDRTVCIDLGTEEVVRD